MRELPEACAHFDANTNTGFTPSAPTVGPGQWTHETASTFFLYGYLIGEYADTLLCGHPDLVY
ncbi:hypothetical protein AXW84_20420 [Hymenobacter sp. PAMC 26628]|nr:hypothetical protein AXW84_20420 [Hymenobacter sp. PAMC 26628]